MQVFKQQMYFTFLQICFFLDKCIFKNWQMHWKQICMVKMQIKSKQISIFQKQIIKSKYNRLKSKYIKTNFSKQIYILQKQICKNKSVENKSFEIHLLLWICFYGFVFADLFLCICYFSDRICFWWFVLLNLFLNFLIWQLKARRLKLK